MGFVLGPLLDPLEDDGDLLRRDGQVGFRWRHLVGGVLRDEAVEDFAPVEVAGDEGVIAGAFGEARKSTFLGVEAEVGFAGVVVRPVAGEAAIRKDRFDVQVEVDLLGKLLLGLRDGLGFSRAAAYQEEEAAKGYEPKGG